MRYQLYNRFSDNQLEQLRRAYAALDKVLPERLPQFHRLFDQCTTKALQQLAEADIRFVSSLARNEVARREAT